IAGWCADCGAKAGRERCRSDRARQRPILCENITKTHCYHFATQLGSTGWYRLEQGRALRQNSVDNSVLARTRQNTKRWPQPHFECGAFDQLRRQTLLAFDEV